MNLPRFRDESTEAQGGGNTVPSRAVVEPGFKPKASDYHWRVLQEWTPALEGGLVPCRRLRKTQSPSASSPKPQQDTWEKALEPTSKCLASCGPAGLRLNDRVLREGKLMPSLIHCLAHPKMPSLQLFFLQFSPSFKA